MATAVSKSGPVPASTRAHKYRSLLLTAAILFAALTVLYSAGWMYYVRQPPPPAPQVEVGFDASYSSAGIEVKYTYPNGPAEKSGLKANDRIIAINGSNADSDSGWSSLENRTWLRAQPGDTVTLTLQRPGQPQPVVITPRFRARQGAGDTKTIARTIADQILELYPLLFLVVGLAVLFLRVGDRNAWLLALVFATFITAADMPNEFAAAPPSFRSFLLAYRTVMGSVLTGLFYFFFAVFPTRSPIDRKIPWLKWALPVMGICLSVGGYRQGDSRALPFILAVVSNRIAQNARRVVVYGSIFLGLISLLWNMFSVSSTDDRRKLKVIFWGTVVGVTPAAFIALAQEVFDAQISFWLNFAKVILLFLFPLSFAYAVVKHRVMDIPVLLKRSARYFVVERGFVFLILATGVGATFWLAHAFSRHFSASSKAAIPVGATFGVLLISAGTEVHRRVRTRLDRAFFRNSYDAQQILEELATRTLTVSNREDLADLLHENIQSALHPQSLYIYLDDGRGQYFAYAGCPPAEAQSVSPKAASVAMLAERFTPMEVYPEDVRGMPIEALHPECLVPIRGSSEGELQGAIILGPLLSEEPYSATDKRLLASVASQAGMAMRSITLAEKMAESMEAERRAAQEMQIARQVQSRLLPQQAPSLPTLDVAGKCIQTREVGGDYYDFLDFGSGRLGLVLADISGKGMSAALLMANLQANLRGQYALALEDVPNLLRSVNRLFYKNTETSHYATMFFAVYDDETRLLRYVNCGHNPPILLRAGGHIEHLGATATVLGLFEEWDCTVAETRLAKGDVLLIYTDGVSEASPNEQDEYGEERLIAAMGNNQQQSAEGILESIINDVQRFSQGEQADDMTLIVALGR